MNKNNIIIEQWRSLEKLTSGLQKKFYGKKVHDGHVVKCVSAKDVFTEDELEKIKRYCKIEPKMCYRTAYRLANLFPDRVKYVEGEATIPKFGFGVEHAWNLVDGEHYVDLTFEFALNEDVTKETYVALGDYNVDVIREVAAETQVYGNVYNQLFIKKYYKPIKK